MSETYQSKRERRQRLREVLPAGLRERISLRNVEAVATLPQQAQTRLLEATQAGLTRMSRAIEQLRADPDTPLAALLDPPSQPVPAPPEAAIFQQEIADLIQECFPDMPRVSAQALAEADVMQVVRSVAETHRQVFQSGHIKTDFVILPLYGLVRQTLERLEEIIEETPALRKTFEQIIEWRKVETC